MPPLRALIPLLLPACFFIAASPVRAQTEKSNLTPVSFEAGAGVSASRENDTTAVAALAWLPPWREFKGGRLHWEAGALYVRGRDHSRFDNGDGVIVVHGGLRYERPSGMVGGFGIGVQDGRTEALSGGPQFISTFGWRWGRFSLLARHISNASLHEPNDGETMLLGTWRF